MSEKAIDISRRRVLAGLGVAGVGAAGAGLGTTAYLNDEESFTDNSMTAGELDLMLDYRATYAGGPGRLDEVDSWYSEEGAGEPFPVQEEEEGVYLIGEVPRTDVEGPDWPEAVQGDDDGSPNFCGPESPLINGNEIPVFTLQDVKPGDAGEVTISLHLCDNPGWVWMNGELTENDENGRTEPEAEVDESGGDPGEGAGELADAIETTLWYDENCNNVHDSEEGESGGPLCVQLVLDESGSLVVGGSDAEDDVENGANQLATDILESSGNSVGVTTFESSGEAVVTKSVADQFTTADIDPQSGQQTYAGEGIEMAKNDLVENCPEGDDRIMVVFTDGGFDDPGVAESQAQMARDAGIEIFAIGVASADQGQLEEIASSDDHVFLGADEENIEQLFSQVSETITDGEQVILSDTLAKVMDALESGIALDGNRANEGRDPFEGGMTHCLGFEWELPTDVGNEIQSDSVGFDLGFYAEQSRNNENPENPYAD